MSLWVASDLWNQQLGRYDMNFTFLLTVTPVAPYNMRHWDGLRFLESTWKNTCLQVSILGWYSWYTSPTDTKTTQKREKFYSENFTCHDCMDISSTDPVCGKTCSFWEGDPRNFATRILDLRPSSNLQKEQTLRSETAAAWNKFASNARKIYRF